MHEGQSHPTSFHVELLMPIKKRPTAPRHSLRKFTLGTGLPSLMLLEAEVQDMWDVLLGRKEPPYWNGTSTLMEVADAFFARASEITALIQEAERKGVGISPSYKRFRTGALRTFMEAAKRSADLGSRRITVDQLEFEQARLGRESA